jgi:hypothetical protein
MQLGGSGPVDDDDVEGILIFEEMWTQLYTNLCVRVRVCVCVCWFSYALQKLSQDFLPNSSAMAWADVTYTCN